MGRFPASRLGHIEKMDSHGQLLILGRLGLIFGFRVGARVEEFETQKGQCN